MREAFFGERPYQFTFSRTTGHYKGPGYWSDLWALASWRWWDRQTSPRLQAIVHLVASRKPVERPEDCEVLIARRKRCPECRQSAFIGGRPCRCSRVVVRLKNKRQAAPSADPLMLEAHSILRVYERMREPEKEAESAAD